jgi:hypothetical protein
MNIVPLDFVENYKYSNGADLFVYARHLSGTGNMYQQKFSKYYSFSYI